MTVASNDIDDTLYNSLHEYLKMLDEFAITYSREASFLDELTKLESS